MKLFLTFLTGTAVALVLLSLGVPQAHAANSNSFIYWGPLVSCTGNGVGGLPQCTSFCDVFATLNNIIRFAMTIALFVLAPGFAIWGGFLIITGGASPNNITTGRTILKNTALGILIVLAAYLIVYTFINIVGIDNNFIGGFGKPVVCTVLPYVAPSAGGTGGGGGGPTGACASSCGACVTQPDCSTNSACSWDSATGKCAATVTTGGTCSSTNCSACSTTNCPTGCEVNLVTGTCNAASSGGGGPDCTKCSIPPSADDPAYCATQCNSKIK